MTRNPIKNPSGWLALLVAGSAIAAGPFPEGPAARADAKAVSLDPSVCMAGQAYTCKVQCGPTTRAPFERFTNTAGVEACVNLGCTCEALVSSVNLDDPTQPTVFVIFGVRQLLPKPPQ